MVDLIEISNFLLAAGTLVLQLITLFLLALYVASRGDVRTHVRTSVLTRTLSRYGVSVAFITVFGVTSISLLYSEVFGFAPCSLCWLQRAFLYPQVVILGIALWRKRRDVADYIIGLSVFGAVIALYQHYLQMGGAELGACLTTGAEVDCAKLIIFELVYITFPLMAFTVFAFLIVLMLFVRRGEGVGWSAHS